MENPFAEVLKTYIGRQAERLTTEEQCGYFAAIRMGVPLEAISLASGLGRSAASHLAAAGERRGGQIRYPKVASAYATLGHEPFVHRFLTPAIHQRCLTAIDQVNHGQKSGRTARGANPRANRYAGKHIFPDYGPKAPVTIQWSDDPTGWHWRSPYDGDNELRGDPRNQEQGFATSRDCYRFLKLRLDPTPEQMDDGSNEAAADDTFFMQRKIMQNRLKNPLPNT